MRRTDTSKISEGERLREIALSRGAPADAVILTPVTPNTAMEAHALCTIATERHWKRVLLVTSAFHMPRAMQLFRSCNAEIVPYPVEYQTSAAHGGQEFEFGNLLPQAGALALSERAIREYLGMAFYAVLHFGR